MGFFNSILNNVVDASKKIMNKDNGEQTPDMTGNMNPPMGNQPGNVPQQPAFTNNMPPVGAGAPIEPQSNAPMPGMQNMSNIPEMPPMASTAGTTAGGFSQPQQQINAFQAQGNAPVPPMPPQPDASSFNPSAPAIDPFANNNQNQMQNNVVGQTENLYNTNMDNASFNPMPNPSFSNSNANSAFDTNTNFADSNFSNPPKNDNMFQQGQPTPAFFEQQNNPAGITNDSFANPGGMQEQFAQPMNQPNQNFEMPSQPIPQEAPPMNNQFINPGAAQPATNTFIDNSMANNFDANGTTDNSTNNWGA